MTLKLIKCYWQYYNITLTYRHAVQIYFDMRCHIKHVSYITFVTGLDLVCLSSPIAYPPISFATIGIKPILRIGLDWCHLTQYFSNRYVLSDWFQN